MKKRSGPKWVQLSAADIPPATAADLHRLRATMKRPVDTSEIPEGLVDSARVRRAPSGRLPVPPPSAIRDAILDELDRREMTRYELWKRARAFCPTLQESAVYEFLRGQRQVGSRYLDALFAALDLRVAHVQPRKRVRKAG